MTDTAPESTEGFDSVHAAAIAAANPPKGSVIAGYVNGAFAWSEADWARFPESDYRLVRIVVYIPGEDIAAVAGDILDVESGYVAAGSPNRNDALNQAHAWTVNRRAAEQIPGWYTSKDAEPELAAVVGTPGAWFLADWTGAEHETAEPGADVIETQYASPTVPVAGEGDFDLSAVNNAAFDQWYDHNHPPTEPAPAPAGPTSPTSERNLVNISAEQVQAGSTGAAVEAVQKLVGNLNVDGIFGPDTEAAVKAFQAAHDLTEDGIVGPHTWGSLIGVPQ